jgi:DnaB helicase-like protein
MQWKTWDEVLKARAAHHEQIAVARVEGTLRPEDLYIPTGIRRWDNNGGVTRGVLTVLGGVDGQGKSIVSNHLAKAAGQHGIHVAQVVMEDPEAQTADRSIANATGIDSRRLGLGTFDLMDLDKIYAAAREAEEWGKYVHYYSGLLSADDVLAGISDLADSLADSNESLGLILVDYAQAFPEKDGNLESVIRHFSWDANKQAQELNCGYVAFSQVKPEISARGHGVFWAARKKDPEAWDVSGFMPGPGTQDLAWASAFGQRGRAVGYIFRPGYYERMLGKPGAVDDRLWIRWAKVNFGNSGLLELRFDGPTGRIYE